MSSTLALAALLVALAASALGLSVLAAQHMLVRVRMHGRAHAVAAAFGLEASGTRPRRAPDPLIEASRLAAVDRWLYRKVPSASRLEEALADAGLVISVSHFLGVAAAAGLFMIVGLLGAGFNFLMALLVGAIAAAAGAKMLISARLQRRRRQFEKLLPEAIGLMVRGLRAGVPVSETVAEVGGEVVDPVGGIFRRAHEQVRLGQSLEGALFAETKPLASQAMNFLIVTLSVQRETGGNLAETLEKLDDIMRRREQMQLKIKAMSSEAKASAFIIGSLPLLMAALMAMVAPDYILPLFTTAAGNVLLAGAGLCLAIGGWLMAQMVRFEV